MEFQIMMLQKRYMGMKITGKDSFQYEHSGNNEYGGSECVYTGYCVLAKMEYKTDRE